MSRQKRAPDEINAAIRGAIDAVKKERGGLRGWKSEAAERLGLAHYQVSKILANDAVGIATAGKIAMHALTWDTDEKRRGVWRPLADAQARQAAPASGLPQPGSPALAALATDLEAAHDAGDDARFKRLALQLAALVKGGAR